MSLLCWSTLALAGSLDAQVAADVLAAGSRSVSPAAGQPEGMGAADVGVRIRGELLEVDDALRINVDYRGRQPVAGAFDNEALHLVYRAEVAYHLPKTELAVGRFLAPSVLWLPMDGVRGTYRDAGSWVTAYAGRRAITLSRRNVAPATWLPAFGAEVGRTTEAYSAQIQGTLAGDQVLLGNADDEVVQDVTGGAGLVRVAVTAPRTVSLGAQASVANQVTYALGAQVGELQATVDVLSLYNTMGWVAWRPSKGARVDLDAVHQRAALSADAASLGLDLVDPSFSDVRLRGAFGRGDRGFVRPDLRLRLRASRTEVRYGGGFELHDARLVGPYLRGRLWLEHVMAENRPAALDRVLWQAGAGWERGIGMVELGAHAVDRALGPVSARSADPGNPTQPLSSEDLAPFVLEAQNVAYARALLAGTVWFAGTDVEVNVEDREVRAFVQVGLRGASRW
ncbi:MAG: hypothetical protein KTR31_06680 [Myxococcales bacterium]|nr:hypothetical protein [Myxococcales bacterium]